MYKALNPGVIGVTAPTLDDVIDAATEALFHAVEISPDEMTRIPAVDVVQKLDNAKLRAAAWGLLGGWRGSDAEYEETLKRLPVVAKAASEIGCTRVYTWILPASDDLTREENWASHVKRLTPIAKVLGEHNCRLGLEYVGPATSRAGKKYEFVYTMDGMLELATAIGPNVGLMLDAWHWYTARETVDQLKGLKNDQIVHVHVNDAPAGVEIDAQLDHKRELPGATGVIDIKGFLEALKSIGYDGPVTPEPFNEELRSLPSDEDRLEAVGYAMEKIWKLANLPQD